MGLGIWRVVEQWLGSMYEMVEGTCHAYHFDAFCSLSRAQTRAILKPTISAHVFLITTDLS